MVASNYSTTFLTSPIAIRYPGIILLFEAIGVQSFSVLEWNIRRRYKLVYHK